MGELEMVKKIKTRKAHLCVYCKRLIAVGSMVMVGRFFFPSNPEYGPPLHTIDMYYHLRCHYRQEVSQLRFNKFVENCPHPEKMCFTAWTYIPGECVKEPDHDECRVCGRVI